MYSIQIEVEHNGTERDVVAGVVGLDVTFGDNCLCGFEFETLAKAHTAYDKLIAWQSEHEIEIDFVVTWYGDELPFEELNTIDTYVFENGAWHIDTKKRTPISLDEMKAVTMIV